MSVLPAFNKKQTILFLEYIIPFLPLTNEHWIINISLQSLHAASQSSYSPYTRSLMISSWSTHSIAGTKFWSIQLLIKMTNVQDYLPSLKKYFSFVLFLREPFLHVGNGRLSATNGRICSVLSLQFSISFDTWHQYSPCFGSAFIHLFFMSASVSWIKK